MQNDIQTLQAMRRRLEHPQSWTQGACARDKHGREIHPANPHAHSFDLIGAHRRCASAKPLPRALWQALRDMGYRFVSQFNDDARRAHGDILLLLDRAIEIARGAP